MTAVDPRDRTVGAVLRDVVDALRQSQAIHQPTPHEQQMINTLISNALRPRPEDPLGMPMPVLAELAAKGRAAAAITEMFPAWESMPKRTLGDWAKTLDPERHMQLRVHLNRLMR